MKTLLRQVWSILDPASRRSVGFVFGAMLIATVLETAGVGVLLPFLKVVADPESHESSRAIGAVHSALGQPSHAEFVLLFAAGMAAFFLVKNMYMAAYVSFMYRVVFQSQAKVAGRLLSAYMSQPQSYHDANNSSEMMRNVVENTRLVHNNVLVALLMLAVEILVTGALLSVLVLVDPVLAPVMAVVLLGVGGCFYLLLRKRAQSAGAAQQTHAEGQIRWVQQALGSLREVRVLGREGYFVRRHEEEAMALAAAARFHAVATQSPRFVIETIGVVAVLLTPGIYVLRGLEPLEAVPVLAVFAAAAVRLMPAVTRLIAALTSIRHFGVAAEIVAGGLRDMEVAESVRGVIVEPVPLESELRLRGVTVRYAEGSPPVLDELDLSISSGESVAIVGPSGAGKTTVVGVLLGLVPTEAGALEVDGTAVEGERWQGWQRTLGYIAQPTYLLDATVRENVALGLAPREIDDARVWESLRDARLAEFVSGLDGELDANIGEGGARISGGQRQRLGIARALYHEPRVLIMDEATSALDNATEREVTGSILSMKGDRTVIVIAHRMSSVMACDRVVFLDGGKVVCEGPYDELLRTSTRFRDFVDGSSHE